jgi:hypothetical protein
VKGEFALLASFGRSAVKGELLDDPAEVHHDDPVTEVPHHAQVVGDEQVRQTCASLKLAEQVDDLGLHGHIERAHRLVGDDQLGPRGESARDPQALALPARELVRVATEHIRGKPDLFEQLGHGGASRRSTARQAERRQGLADDRLDGESRVERRERILEDELHALARAAQRPARERAQVDAVEQDATRVQLLQAEQAPTERGLSAATLSNEADDLAARQ